MRNFLIKLIPMILLVLFFSKAHGHSWYPFECCSERDCSAIPPNNVVRVGPTGYQVRWGGGENDIEVIPHTKVRMSPDGQYHRCALPSSPSRSICFYAPTGSF
jgi:hypothetical protein